MNAMEKLFKNGIYISQQQIIQIVKKYRISELSVFGSSLREDFTSESDIDLLIEFKESEKISLFDIIDIQEYFEKITGRKIDVVEAGGITNPYRKHNILTPKEILYAA